MRRKNDVTLGPCDEKITIENLTPYTALKFLSNKSQNSGLKEEFWSDDNVRQALEVVKKVLPFNNFQIILFAIISAYTLGCTTASIRDLGSKLNINPYDLFVINKDLDDLIRKGYLKSATQRYDREVKYSANKKILVSLRDGVVPPTPKNETLKSNLELIHFVFTMVEDNFGEIDALEESISFICEKYSDLDLVKRMEEMDFTMFERCLLFCGIDYLITKQSDISFGEYTQMVAMNESDFVYKLNSYLYREKGPLVQKKYIEMVDGDFNQDEKIHITSKAINELLPEEKDLVRHSVKGSEQMGKCKLIKPKQIYPKELIYDEKTEEQVQTLRDILSQQGLHTLQKSLKKEGLHQGINVLLYGAAGAGKTETVLQLCKENNRNLLQVNISDTKSKLFGQSEKIVNNLFEEYNWLIKHSKRIPVLLFNEADGVLSRRRNISDNEKGCQQTENAIQNILLQSFENNGGIIICTTNMINNLDTAFSRRFLYKIEFGEPDVKTRTALIKLKLGKYVTNEEALILASTYKLTGGTLDNILTKIIAKKCLYDVYPDFNEIETYCKQETLRQDNSRRAVGFSLTA